MAAKAKLVDWTAVEVEYRAGVRSLRSIGAGFGVSNVAILKHANQEGWERDLSERIRLKTAAKVSAAMVSAKVSKVTEQQAVDVNANAQAAVILSHRRDISDAREIVNKLIAELRRAVKDHDLVARSTVAQRLVNALSTLIDKERQVFGIDRAGDVKETLQDFLARP